VIATRQRRYRRTVPRRSRAKRLRRTGGLLLSLSLTVVVALAAMHGNGGAPSTAGIAAVPTATLAADGPPRPQPLAALGSFQLEVPIRQERITAIVYHGIGDANVIPLQPIGTQVNAGFLTRLTDRLFGGGSPDGPRYAIDDAGAGPDTGSVDVGAIAGTTVYAPADGVVVSVRPYYLDGRRYGNVVQIRPDAAPSITITMTNLTTLRSAPVQVGDRVEAARTALGTVIDLSQVLEQTLARYTNDAGNHVAISLGPAAGASPIL
jgi:hypothetical protein